MKEQIIQRIRSLQEEIRSLGLDAAIIMDRENLIYFAGVEDLEGGSLVIPVDGEVTLFCLWLEAVHMKEVSGIRNVVPYIFPQENVSQKTAEYIAGMGISKPKIGFTRYFISLKDFQCLQQAVPGIEVGDIGQACYKIRSIKTEKEIEYITKASEFVAYGMKAAVEAVKPDVKETDILAEADYAMKKAGSEGASFRMQVLRHDRQQLVHPYAGDYLIENNQPVVIHLGASYKGYTAKMCRTVFLGDVGEESLKIYTTLIEAQKVAIDSLIPGVKSAEVYGNVYKYIEEQGYGKMFIDYIGYGVGIRQSEFYPILGKNIDHIIEANMVVDVLLPTLYKPKAGGPRITDTILVRENGCKFLTDFDRTPIFR
ncbi:M24 family metallopeptidase [Geosporobacter ferrireducens]|uniref:Creatininase n=1 Tax=Geosporobacter ferrireducens TaxID=1424294 RepID=A0A1D8GK44_9FIRM|nr:Xaa-Pro peptidase family protein [Geosporobacter ferrireducens]AOT71281.1 creatininase [Geosporobacter ferrireducens]